MTWNDTPGAAILKRRQWEDIPSPDFLMNQQGWFSGKNVGDLDSVPGYYGATLSVQFPQNAPAIKRIRKARAEHNLKTHGVLVTPFEKRLEALRQSVMFAPKPKRPENVSKARGVAFKYAGERGAQYGARQVDELALYPKLARIFSHGGGGNVRMLERMQRGDRRDKIPGVSRGV